MTLAQLGRATRTRGASQHPTGFRLARTRGNRLTLARRADEHAARMARRMPRNTRRYSEGVSRATGGRRTTARTRFRAPEWPDGSINRPRMDERIDAANRSHRVAVVTAPSGFGKTMAVSAWASASSAPVAWLSLGRFDSNQALLNSGVIEALKTAVLATTDPALLPILELDSDAEPIAAYRTICSAFQSCRLTVTLVVDDAHRAGGGLADGLLGAMIDDAPETLRLVLVGTSYLEIALSKLAITTPDRFVTASDLAFDAREIEAIASAHGTPLQPDAIQAETEGWPIAVRLVLVGGVRPTRRDGVASYDEAPLQDYVRDHVLATLPPELSSFIVKTAICAELTADLAEAITGDTHAGASLERCARLGLFIERFTSDDGMAYRWHSVFARQCRRILESGGASQLRDLHLRASAYLEPFDALAAISHAVSAGDLQRAVDVLLSRWVGLIVGSDATGVAQVCGGFPRELADDPRVLVIRACAHDVIGEHTVSHALYELAIARKQNMDVLEGAHPLMELARLFLVDDRAGAAEASAHVREALSAPGQFSTEDRAAVLYLLGWAELRHRTNPDLIIELLASAVREAHARSETSLERRASNHLAFAYAWAGKLQQARDMLAAPGLREEVATSPWAYYAGGGGASAEGFVAYWAADLDTAYSAYCRVIDSGGARTSFGGVARMFLAATAAAGRDGAMCRRAAAEIHSIPVHDAQGLSWPAFHDTAVAVLEEAAGRRERAVAIAERYADATNLPFAAVVLSGILRRAGNVTAALQMVQQHRGYHDLSYVRVAIEATAALVHKRSGNTELAHERCEAALSVAVIEDIRLPFCDGDLDMRQLLADHLSHGTKHADFIAECLTFHRDGDVLSALSGKEHTVFRLLQTGRTMQEIAEELDLSVNTIKTHLRSIYRKLGVASRREAQRLVI